MLNKNQKEVEELSNSSNIIGKGTIVNGSIETFGIIRVEGKVVGDIKTKSKAAFGHSSKVEGSVLAQNAEVAGSGTVLSVITSSNVATLYLFVFSINRPRCSI